jgi:hypothetical protein
VEWRVEYTDEFENWWGSLDEEETRVYNNLRSAVAGKRADVGFSI